MLSFKLEKYSTIQVVQIQSQLLHCTVRFTVYCQVLALDVSSPVQSYRYMSQPCTAYFKVLSSRLEQYRTVCTDTRVSPVQPTIKCLALDLSSTVQFIQIQESALVSSSTESASDSNRYGTSGVVQIQLLTRAGRAQMDWAQYPCSRQSAIDSSSTV
jgi:hypothetical protein